MTNSCSKLDRQKGFNTILFSYKISRLQNNQSTHSAHHSAGDSFRAPPSTLVTSQTTRGILGTAMSRPAATLASVFSHLLYCSQYRAWKALTPQIGAAVPIPLPIPVNGNYQSTPSHTTQQAPRTSTNCCGIAYPIAYPSRLRKSVRHCLFHCLSRSMLTISQLRLQTTQQAPGTSHIGPNLICTAKNTGECSLPNNIYIYRSSSLIGNSPPLDYRRTLGTVLL